MKRLVAAAVGACLLLGQMFAGGEEAKKPAGEPIKIGAIFAVTGPASFLGAPEARTAQLFVDKLNEAGGLLGRPVQLVVEDSTGDSPKALSSAKRLIEEQKVLAIIGPSTSGETKAIKDLCESEKMLLVSCAAAEFIVNPVAKYVFKTPQKDSQAVVWIYKTMKDMGVSKIAVLSGNDGFGQAGKKQLETMAAEHGITIVANEVYDVKTADFSDVVTKVKAAEPQAVVNWTVAPAQSIVAKNMKQLGLNVPLFNSHGFGNRKYVEQAGQAAEGIIFPAGRLLIADSLPADHPQKAVLASYKKDYEDKFKGDDVSTFGGHAYDALLIIVKAVEKAQSTDRAKVRDALESLKGVVGTAGVFNFSAEDHNGLGLDAFEMLTVKEGKFTLYKK